MGDYVSIEGFNAAERERDFIDWERRVLASALLRLEAVLVQRFGQPSGDDLLAVAHRGIRIALRNPGVFYHYLQSHPDLRAAIDDNSVPPIEWELEGAAMEEATREQRFAAKREP